MIILSIVLIVLSLMILPLSMIALAFFFIKNPNATLKTDNRSSDNLGNLMMQRQILNESLMQHEIRERYLYIDSKNRHDSRS